MRVFLFKNMKYFLHDSNSFNDEKITELFINFGYEGLGLFYTLLEKLASQEKPIKTEILKHQLKVGKKLEKCWNFMENIELISSNNGETFNKQLLNYSEKYQIKKEKNAKKILEWRKNQELTKNVTSYEPSCNLPKVNKSKDIIYKEEKKEKNIPAWPDFLNYAIQHKPLVNKNDLELKYKAWIESGWKCGNPQRDIKNWKSTLLNTLPHIKEEVKEEHNHVYSL
jgi:hypothetical protein